MTKTTEMTKIKKTTAIVFLSFLFISLIFVISFVFSGAFILPQTFSLGFLNIHYYGLTMASAVAAAFYLAVKRAPKYGIDLKIAEDLLFWLIIGGFIGARFYHVLSSIGYYHLHPIDILKVWNGGLSIYGALLGGLVTIWLYKKYFILHTSYFILLDWLAPSLLLGQIIGRFGNFFNYEAFGYPTNLPWKMFVPPQFRPLQFQSYNFFHPFFLYEVLGNIIILFLLLKLIEPSLLKKERLIKGYLFFSYLLLYNILRFALEFFRTDSTFIGIFRLNAIVSLALVFVAILALLIIRHRSEF